MMVKNLQGQGPIRVVLFFGPSMDWQRQRLIAMLVDHPDITLVGAFCQSGRTLSERLRKKWKRRGLFAIPILAAQTVFAACRMLRHPLVCARLRRKVRDSAVLIHYISSFHDERTLALVRALQPDLGLVSGAPILKPILFDIPQFGSIGIHHGKVPEYRGVKTVFWAMYNGESTAGVTIQKIGKGLDTGDIVKCGDVPIGRKSLTRVMAELETMGLELFIQAVLGIRTGTAVCEPQRIQGAPVYQNPGIKDILRFHGRQWKRFWRTTRTFDSGERGKKKRHELR